MTYHPFLSRLASEGRDELAARLLEARVDGIDPALIGGMSRDRLMAALLDWADETGLARGQGDFGFIMRAHAIHEGLLGRYGEGVA